MTINQIRHTYMTHTRGQPVLTLRNCGGVFHGAGFNKLTERSSVDKSQNNIIKNAKYKLAEMEPN